MTDFAPTDEDRLNAYYDWIKANKDRQGSPDFEKVADAYRSLRQAGVGDAPAAQSNSSAGAPYTDDKFTAADFDRLNVHADWLRANRDKQGTPEFVKAADAYRSLRQAQWGAEDRAAWAKPDNSPAAGASAFMSGLNKGAVADTLGAPVDAVNWGLRKLGAPVSDKPFMGSGWLTDKMQDAHMVQPSRGWDKTAHAGELLGSGIGNAAFGGAVAPMAEAAGMARTASIAKALGPVQPAKDVYAPAKTLAGTLAGQAAGAGLQMAGEGVGGALGGAPGAAIGGMLAPMAPALAMKGVGEPLARGVFARPDGASGEAFDTLTANGITPTPGLVGNRAMAHMENAAGFLPNVPGMGADSVKGSFRDFQNRVYGLSDMAAGRDYGVTTRAPDVSAIGDNIQRVATDGLTNTRARLSGERESILQAFGPQTLIPVQDAVPKIRDMGATVYEGQDRPRTSPDLQNQLGAELARLNAVRVPASPIAEGLLRNDLNARQTMLDADPRMRPNVAAGLRNEISDIQGRVEANRQVPAEALDDVMSKIGRDTQGNPTLDTGQSKQVWKAINDARQAAYDAKDPSLGARLRAANEEYARLNSKNGPRADGGDIPYLRQLTEASDGGAVYKNMTAGTWEKPDIVRRNNPEAWPGVAGDVIAAKSTATPARQSEDIIVSPAEFASWWGGLSPRARIVYANGSGDTLGKLNALHDAARLFVQRGGAANFSNTAPATAAAAFMGSALSHPVHAIGALASSALMASLARNQGLARILADRAPGLAQSLAPAGVRAVGRELAGGGR